MNKRTVNITIAGRKVPGYPEYNFTFSFTTMEDLMKQADKKADELEIGKMDLYIDTKTTPFSDEEREFMKNEYCIIN